MTLWEVVSRFCDNNVRSAILQSTQKSQKYIIGMFTIHKLSVLIMDEKLENRKNEEITVDNALQYLYYDFER